MDRFRKEQIIMLATLNDLMKIAEEKQIAIGSFNTPNLEALQAVIAAAEEEDLPAIVMFAQCHEPWIPVDVIGPVMIQLAEKASVPICVHLDHGETLDYVQKCVELGFTGIMYDGSVLPYEENLANSRKAVELAAKTGASVEVELGTMGRRESGAGDDTGADDETKIYTDPDLAAEFVKQTGTDLLACSFGTTHGIYLEEPKLDFDVVRNVRKINYFTYMDKAGGTAARETVMSAGEQEPLFFSTVSMAARDAMKENARAAMRMFALRD